MSPLVIPLYRQICGIFHQVGKEAGKYGVKEFTVNKFFDA